MCIPRKDWSQQVRERAVIDPEGWSRCERLNKIDAEMLLDWLEANGYSQREVSYEDEGGFTVRWRK